MLLGAGAVGVEFWLENKMLGLPVCKGKCCGCLEVVDEMVWHEWHVRADAATRWLRSKDSNVSLRERREMRVAVHASL